MDDEGSNQQGGRRRAGNAKGKERDEIGPHRGAVGGLGGDDPVQVTLAERLGIFRCSLRRPVAHERQYRRPDPGQRATYGADNAGADKMCETIA